MWRFVERSIGAWMWRFARYLCTFALEWLFTFLWPIRQFNCTAPARDLLPNWRNNKDTVWSALATKVETFLSIARLYSTKSRIVSFGYTDDNFDNLLSVEVLTLHEVKIGIWSVFMNNYNWMNLRSHCSKKEWRNDLLEEALLRITHIKTIIFLICHEY